jgi:hypothetical protein
MVTTIIFVSSLFIALAMILFHAIEMKKNKSNPLLKGLRRADIKSGKLIANLSFRWLQLCQSIRYIVLVQIKEISKIWFTKLEEKVVNEYRLRQSSIMGGQKQIAKNGSASFYLKKITEHKDNEGKGKIEDNSIDSVLKE